jgi:hypothetical protein
MPIEKDDKIAITVLAVLIGGVTISCLLVFRWLFVGVLGLIELDSGGVGWRSAFLSSIVLSFLFGYFAICVGGLVSGHARHLPDVVV